MAEETPIVGQKLNFGAEGTLEVVASLTTPSGLLHKTVDGGFYYRPGMPLNDQDVADSLPEPYKEEATEFIAGLEPEA